MNEKDANLILTRLDSIENTVVEIRDHFRRLVETEREVFAHHVLPEVEMLDERDDWLVSPACNIY